MRGGNSSSLKDPIAFLDQKPSAENVIEEIALLYRVTPTYVADEADVLLLLKHMRLYIQYLNNQPEMASEALLKGYLLDETLFPENCTPYNFIKNIKRHKSFKFRYNKSISAQTFAESLNALDEIAQADEMRMSRMREDIIWEEKNDPPMMHPPQRNIMIHRLCHIIQNLAITPDHAPYIQWDCRTVTHPTFREYLLTKVNNLHRPSNNHEEKFLRHFRGLLWMIMAIVAFQQKAYSKGTFTQFTRGLYIAVKKYKTEEEEKKSELGIYIPGTMQDFYIDRICLGVNVVLFHSVQEVYDHLSRITDELYQDFYHTRKLAIEVSLIVNNNLIKEHFKTHLIDLDDHLLAYLEKKIKSETKILDVYKHLKHVVKFLLLLTNPQPNISMESDLRDCCKDMGTSGIKTCLQSMLNDLDDINLLHHYPTDMRQTALIYRLDNKSQSEQVALFAVIHDDPLFLADWIEILKKKENCTSFYENYLHYLRQSESDYPGFCRLETELFPSLRHFKRDMHNIDVSADFNSYTSTLAISASSVFWSVFVDVIRRKPPSLNVGSIYRNTQEVIQQIRTLLQAYLVKPSTEKIQGSKVVQPLDNDHYDEFLHSIIARRSLRLVECHSVIQDIGRMQDDVFAKQTLSLLKLLEWQKKFNYAFVKSLRLALTRRANATAPDLQLVYMIYVVRETKNLQQIADSREFLMLLGKLFLSYQYNSEKCKRGDYEELILLRGLRNSITGEHTFSRVLEELARENPIQFKDSFAWWFVQQPTLYSYHNWTSGKPKLAKTIEAIINEENASEGLICSEANSLSAEDYFCKNNPPFETFQCLYLQECDPFFSKEEYVFFLQNQKFERAMEVLADNTPLAFIEKLYEMVLADEAKVLPDNSIVYINYISPGRAQHLTDIFEDLKTKMPELNTIPEGADRSIADYLMDKTFTVVKRDDVFLRHFKGLTEMALAMLTYVNNEDKDRVALVSALKNAVQTYKGTLSYSPDFWKKNAGTDKMTNTYIGHLVQSMRDTIDDDNSPEKGMGIELRGTRNPN